MATVGRKPKPTNIHILHGKPGKRALPKHEPKPPRGIPACPAWLSKDAKDAWKRIAPELDRMGVLTLADGSALELMVDAYAEWRQARRIVAKEGATLKGKTSDGRNTVKTHPAVQIARDAWRRFLAALTEFGLTPSSRARVGRAPEGAPPDPFDAFLEGDDEED